MPALNNVQLIGHLGKDPETRQTATGKKVCHFSMAVNRPGDGEAEWFAVEAWEKLAEVCQQYLAKGRLVYVEGRLKTERWNDGDGEARSRTVVVARQMQMLDRKPNDQDVAAEPEAADAF